MGTYTGRPRVILSLPPGAPRLGEKVLSVGAHMKRLALGTA